MPDVSTMSIIETQNRMIEEAAAMGVSLVEYLEIQKEKKENLA